MKSPYLPLYSPPITAIYRYLWLFTAYYHVTFIVHVYHLQVNIVSLRMNFTGLVALNKNSPLQPKMLTIDIPLEKASIDIT